jgi:hypothetical protein
MILRPPPSQLQAVPRGAGRLLTMAYLAGGLYCKRKFGRLAHRWGCGPDAVAKQIWQQMEKDGDLLELADLDQDVARKLERKCRKLMEYALPYIFPVSNFCDSEANLIFRIETPAAQTRAFKNIICLATRALGLKRIFASCTYIQEVGISQTCITELWRGNEPIPDPEWKFYLEFAASCVSDEDKLGGLVEAKKLDELISVVPIDNGEYSVIEKLLIASNDG